MTSMVHLRGLKAALLLVALGCSSESENPTGSGSAVEVAAYKNKTAGEVVARVGKGVISTEDLNKQLNRGSHASGQEITLAQKKEAVEKLIEQEVLYQEARRKGFAEHPRVKMMMISLLQREAVGSGSGNSETPEEELRDYFEKHKEEYLLPEKVRARRILIQHGGDRNASKAKAQEIREKVAKDPANFSQLARDLGEGPERARGGELGFFPKTGRPGLETPLVAKAFSLKANEVSEVFSTAEGWNILKVEGRQARTERTFNQVRRSLNRRLLAEKRRNMMTGFVEGLKAKATVSVDEGALKGFAPEIKSRAPIPPGAHPPHFDSIPGMSRGQLRTLGQQGGGPSGH